MDKYIKGCGEVNAYEVAKNLMWCHERRTESEKKVNQSKNQYRLYRLACQSPMNKNKFSNQFENLKVDGDDPR